MENTPSPLRTSRTTWSRTRLVEEISIDGMCGVY
jgi:hypothetical protein